MTIIERIRSICCFSLLSLSLAFPSLPPSPLPSTSLSHCSCLFFMAQNSVCALPVLTS